MEHPKRIEVLAVGDELLDGRVADTNTLRLAAALSLLGLRIAQRTTVPDVLDDIVREARAIAARGTDLCVVSGGLGPTADDLTAAALARAAGVPMVRDARAVAALTELLGSRGREVNETQLRQADRPRGSELLLNPLGTAPGFMLSYGGCRFLSLPGVPREFDAMLEATVLAPLRAGAQPLARRILRCFGLVESEVDRRLADIGDRAPRVRVGFRAKFPEVHVSLTASPGDERALEIALGFARERLGDHVFSESDDSLAAVVLARLRERNESFAVAESCTGGLLADLATDVPGASEAFAGGVTAYANAAKMTLLDVRAATLAQHGAVSEATVLEMAAGARRRFSTSYAVAASGIAGPAGGAADKPVGTVWLAVEGPTRAIARKLQLPFDRRGNKLASAYAALDLLRRELDLERRRGGA